MCKIKHTPSDGTNPKLIFLTTGRVHTPRGACLDEVLQKTPSALCVPPRLVWEKIGSIIQPRGCFVLRFILRGSLLAVHVVRYQAWYHFSTGY